MNKGLVSAVVGLALVLGATAIPVQAASATSLGKLTVQLVDVKGKALHLKNVQLALTNKGAETDWTTNSSGLADFHSVGASKTYTVSTVTASKYVPAKKTNIVVKAGHTTHATLKLIVGATISGVVANTEGQHPNGITVQFVKKNSQHVAASVLTSATGHYASPGLATGKYTVFYNYPSIDTEEFPRLGILTQGLVSVTQQTTKHAALSKKHYDATLTTLYKLSGTTTQAGATSITAYDATTNAAWKEYDFRPAASGASTPFELYLPAGVYRVSADIDGGNSTSNYWYVGDSVPTSTFLTDATTISLTDDRAIVVKAHG